MSTIWNRTINYKISLVIKKGSIQHVLESLFVFFCFFPYIRIIPLPTDAQPNALALLSLIWVIFYVEKGIKQSVFWLLATLILSFSFSMTFFFDGGFSVLRSLVNYLSLFILSIGTLFLFQSGFRPSYRFYTIAMWVYIIVSSIQTFFYRYFLNFLTLPMRTSATRGVTGITPEPGYNATVAVFFLIIYLLLYYPYKSKRNFFLIAFWILFLARSASVSLMVLIALSIYFLIRRPWQTLLIGIIGFLGLYFTVIFFLEDSVIVKQNRLLFLLSLALEKPTLFFVLDTSVNERLSHVVVSFYLSITEMFIPHGPDMDHFNQQILVLQEKTFPWLLVGYEGATGFGFRRILSTWGMLLYECGFFGLFFMLYLFGKSLKYFHQSLKLLAILLFFFILIYGNSFVTSTVPFIIGILFYQFAEKSGQKSALKKP